MFSLSALARRSTIGGVEGSSSNHRNGGGESRSDASELHALIAQRDRGGARLSSRQSPRLPSSTSQNRPSISSSSRSANTRMQTLESLVASTAAHTAASERTTTAHRTESTTTAHRPPPAPAVSTTTKTRPEGHPTATLERHNDNEEEERYDAKAVPPPYVGSYRDLVRPASRGRVPLPGEGARSSRVMSGQPSPRFVFAGDTGLTSFTLVGATSGTEANVLHSTTTPTPSSLTVDGAGNGVRDDHSKPLTDRKRKPSRGVRHSATPSDGGVDAHVTTAHAHPALDWQSLGFGTGTAPVLLPSSSGVSFTNHPSLLNSSSSKGPSSLVSAATCVPDGFPSLPSPPDAVLAPALPPRPSARQKEPSLSMDLFSCGLERSPPALDALVVVKSNKNGTTTTTTAKTRKQSADLFTAPKAGRLDSTTPLSPSMLGGGVVEVLGISGSNNNPSNSMSPSNHNGSNAVIGGCRGNASFTSENPSTSTTPDSDNDSSNTSGEGDVPCGSFGLPLSPAKTKSTPKATTKQTHRFGSGRGHRLEDVALFPVAPTSSGVSLNNSELSSGRRRSAHATSAAKQQPPHLLPTNVAHSVEDDFGADPFPMQKQKKKKIPIIIEDEWDDVWAFPNQHLLQQQQQQQQQQQHQRKQQNATSAADGVADSDEQQPLMMMGATDSSSRMAVKPKAKPAWTASSHGGGVPTPHTGEHHLSHNTSCDTAGDRSEKTTQAVAASSPSMTVAEPSYSSKASSVVSPTSVVRTRHSGGVQEGLPLGDLSAGHPEFTTSPMIPSRSGQQTKVADALSQSGGRLPPRPPSTEPAPPPPLSFSSATLPQTRRSKEGSFRRSFPGAEFTSPRLTNTNPPHSVFEHSSSPANVTAPASSSSAGSASAEQHHCGSTRQTAHLDDTTTTAITDNDVVLAASSPQASQNHHHGTAAQPPPPPSSASTRHSTFTRKYTL